MTKKEMLNSAAFCYNPTMGQNEARSKAAAIFMRAAAYIRQYGWQKTGMGINGTPRCSMGALASAQPGAWDKRLASTMYDALYRELDGLSLTQFNYRYNDGDMVARLYERAAASLQ